MLGAVFPCSQTGALPAELFEAEKHIRIRDLTVAMKHYPPAHTDGDISVHFEELDILHVGDTWSNGLYPYIDASSSGHINGMIEATEANLHLASPTTLIIPGHVPVGGSEHLQRSLDMLVGVREAVATHRKHGLNLNEVIEKKTRSFVRF